MPPVSDGVRREGGSIVGDADHQSTSVFVDIVNSIRNGNPAGVGAEIVIVDAAWRAFPTAARIFELADEFAFLAVDADDGQMATLEAVAQVGKICELEVAVWADGGGDLLVIDAERIAHLIEQSGDGVGRNGNAECCQFLGDGRGSAARPA